MCMSYDDFLYAGYGSSMSYSEYVRQNCAPVVCKSAAEAYDDFTYSGYSSSMSFESYCKQRGIILVGTREL